MKQYEAFFRAAPEAFIQITFRIVRWSNRSDWQDEGNRFFQKKVFVII